MYLLGDVDSGENAVANVIATVALTTSTKKIDFRVHIMIIILWQEELPLRTVPRPVRGYSRGSFIFAAERCVGTFSVRRQNSEPSNKSR